MIIKSFDFLQMLYGKLDMEIPDEVPDQQTDEVVKYIIAYLDFFFLLALTIFMV